jgi:23S rRNA pseudouridine2605 synthase
MSDTETVRINKFLALHTGISRREADEAVSHGRVQINGAVAEMGSRVSNGDTVTLDNKQVAVKTSYSYLLLNKPIGYVCSRRRQGEAPTIYELMPEEYRSLKPVGRLDKESSGLLLLTDDGDFAHRMTHPSFHKTKTYEIDLSKDLQPLHRQMISDMGVTLDDGVSTLHLDRLTEGNDKGWIVQMHEGRNRQIRRTFASLGYEVTRLHRTYFGNYSLGDIKPGSFVPVDIH